MLDVETDDGSGIAMATGGAFVVTSDWLGHGTAPAERISQAYPTLDEAIHAGLHLSCLSGVTAVTVEHGTTIHCEYDRRDNLWHSRTIEAKRYADTGSAALALADTILGGDA